MLERTFLSEFSVNQQYLQLSKNNVLWSDIEAGAVLAIRYVDCALEKIDIRGFIGLCIRKKARQLHSSFLLRNASLQATFESLFFFQSPILLNMRLLSQYKRKFRLCKLYFMRGTLGLSYKL